MERGGHFGQRTVARSVIANSTVMRAAPNYAARAFRGNAELRPRGKSPPENAISAC